MELTKVNFETFLKNLKFWNENEEGMKTHGTDSPVFEVQSLERTYGFDAIYSDESIILHEEDEFETVEEAIESLDPDESDVDMGLMLRNASCDSLETFFKLDERSQIFYLLFMPWGFKEVYYKDTFVHVNSHLTREAAQVFIDRKSHDYKRGLQIFVSSNYWCWEFNMIVQGILSGKIGLTGHHPVNYDDFISYLDQEDSQLAFPDNLKITFGREYIHKNGQNGFCFSFNIEENTVSMYTGGGFCWNGSGQEFAEQWTKL